MHVDFTTTNLKLYRQYSPMETSFYKQHTQAGWICLLGEVGHAQNAEQTSHSALAIVAKEML